MESYMVIVKVDGVNYLTKVKASSRFGAEFIARHLSPYDGVIQACQVYDQNDMMHG